MCRVWTALPQTHLMIPRCRDGRCTLRSEVECIASCIALSNVHRLSSSDELGCFGRHRGRCEDVDPNRAGLNADLRLLTQRADMNLSTSDTARRGVDSQAFGLSSMAESTRRRRGQTNCGADGLAVICSNVSTGPCFID